MTRATIPGTIQEAVQACYDAYGDQKDIALDLGIAGSSVSYGTEVQEIRPGGLGVNYLDRLARMKAASAVPIARHFAALAGGVFQPVAVDGALAADVHQLTREFSDVLALHADAHSARSRDPGDYTPHEARQQIREIDEMVTAAMLFRAQLMARAEGQGGAVAAVPIRGSAR
ncbi:hypothetical protein [Pararhodobacter aggregans]|uniref:Uncharacterized protein n=1 Tax=Pararhodobacter aggregans TaxID=404875 RepID=A0A2T7URK3_9RHOB|nr:hypothetical protein [Pararhodobacter aggregans]PTX02047.1 hypothetical protein C8N33_106266 [Pararhodobacter aggregans]PVE47221.1 hypothetical protein DDE23_13345 [Pararhodobacter aggregans]